MNVKMIVAAILAAGVLIGCVNVPSAPRGVLIAKQACEINALAEERKAMVNSISAANNLYPRQYQRTEEQRYTILQEKLKAYSGEVEASYRFVTANCNSYNLCMEQNRFDETRCSESRKAWTDSHAKFNELAIAINDATKPWGHKKPGHHHGGCKRSDCNVQGGVFATGCCYDGD